MSRIFSLATLFSGVLGAALAGCTQSQPGAVGVGNATQRPNPANQQIAAEGRITAGNADRLGPAWTVSTPMNVSHMPLLREGKLYFADWGGTVFCVDAQDGRILWQKHVQTPREMWPLRGFVATGAIGYGMVYEVSAEGDAYALDLYSGETVWHMKLTDDPNAGSLATPLYHEGKLYIALQSVDPALAQTMSRKTGMPYQATTRGQVMCLDARTGNTLWKKQLVEETRAGVYVRGGFALDTESNTLFFTTGNSYSGRAAELSNSIVAMKAGSGDILWHFQPAAGEEHEVAAGRAETTPRTDTPAPAEDLEPAYEFGAAPTLFDAGGRRLVGAGSTDGFYYALDRDTGQRVWARQVGQGNIAGGIRDVAAADNGRLYLWSNNDFNDLKPIDPALRPLTVACLDAATGRIIWLKPNAQAAAGTSSGILVNDVYFVGSLDGTISGYRAADGAVLWRGQVRGGSIASSINAGGDAIFVGAGLPKIFDGLDEAKGVYAYSINRNAQPAAAEVPAGR